jgi:dihydroorotase
VFDEENALDRFEAFASLNGAHFYGLEPNRSKMLLTRQPSRAAEVVAIDGDEVVVFRGGEDLDWSIEEVRQ